MAEPPKAFAPGSAALRYFQAVAECGSFRRAAAVVRIAPSALSRQVRLLEDELGAELLERARDGVRPTAAGEALLLRLGRAAQELEAGRAEIHALKSAERGHVVLGVTDKVAREFLPRFLTGFRLANPGITFDIVLGKTGNLMARLAGGEIEVMIAYSVPADAVVDRLVAFELVTCLMVHRQHRLARLRTVRVKDLAEETMILPDADSQIRRILDAIFAHAAVRPRSAITSASPDLMANLVSLEYGVAFQNRLGPGADVLWPDVVYVPLAERVSRPVSLACGIRPGRPLSRAAAVCTKALVRSLQDWVSRQARPS
jgi:DNA-binding transcriptional LysR family regulator